MLFSQKGSVKSVKQLCNHWCCFKVFSLDGSDKMVTVSVNVVIHHTCTCRWNNNPVKIWAKSLQFVARKWWIGRKILFKYIHRLQVFFFYLFYPFGNTYSTLSASYNPVFALLTHHGQNLDNKNYKIILNWFGWREGLKVHGTISFSIGLPSLFDCFYA